MASVNNLQSMGEVIDALPKTLVRTADDLHRMVNYMGELRLVIIGLSICGVLGALCYAIYQIMQKREEHKETRAYSDRSTMMRVPPNGYGGQYYQHPMPYARGPGSHMGEEMARQNAPPHHYQQPLYPQSTLMRQGKHAPMDQQDSGVIMEEDPLTRRNSGEAGKQQNMV